MIQLNVKTTYIYKQLFTSTNLIPLSNGNPSCVLNFKSTNNKKNNKKKNFKSRTRGSNIHYVILSQVFLWVRQIQDILGRWKLVPMMTTSGHQGTLQFFWMVNDHFNNCVLILFYIPDSLYSVTLKNVFMWKIYLIFVFK